MTRRSFVRVRTACGICHRAFLADRLDLVVCDAPACARLVRLIALGRAA